MSLSLFLSLRETRLKKNVVFVYIGAVKNRVPVFNLDPKLGNLVPVPTGLVSSAAAF